MREFLNHTVMSMSDSTMAVSSKYTQDLSVQIVFFTFSCKWFLCIYFWAVIWSYIVDLFAALHELASASARTVLKLASSVRALLKPYGDTWSKNRGSPCSFKRKGEFIPLSSLVWGKSLTCTCTRSCARADDAKIVRSKDAQCNTKELP